MLRFRGSFRGRRVFGDRSNVASSVTDQSVIEDVGLGFGRYWIVGPLDLSPIAGGCRYLPAIRVFVPFGSVPNTDHP